MSAKAKIPPELEPDIVAKAAEGLTTRQLAAWLSTAHGITITQPNVARFLKKARVERSEISKGIVREKLGTSVGQDIDRLEAIRVEVQEKAEKVDTQGVYRDGREGPVFGTGVTEWTRLKDLEVKVIDKKLHYSGAGEPDKPDEKQRGVVVALPPWGDGDE